MRRVRAEELPQQIYQQQLVEKYHQEEKSKLSNLQCLESVLTYNMVDNKNTLDTDKIVEALKKAGFPTKKDVEDIVHNQLTEFHANMTMPELDKLNNRMGNVENKLGNVEKSLEEVKNDIRSIKDDVKNIESDISVLPTQSKYDSLGLRVRKLEIARGDI